jgi:hypothetical protein
MGGGTRVRLMVGAAVLAGLAAGAPGVAHADQPTPAPAPALTSTSDELADMVMAAIEQGSVPPLTVPVDPPQ